RGEIMSIRGKLISGPLGHGATRVEVSYDRKEKQECLPRGCTSCFVLETSSGSPSLCSTPTEVRLNPAARWLRPMDVQARQQCGASFVRGVTGTGTHQAGLQQRQVQKNQQATTNSVRRIR